MPGIGVVVFNVKQTLLLMKILYLITLVNFLTPIISCFHKSYGYRIK